VGRDEVEEQKSVSTHCGCCPLAAVDSRRISLIAAVL